MSSGNEDKIRSRAHTIWEREGRPEGKEQEHWAQAGHEIENEEAAGASSGEQVKVTVADDPTRPQAGASAGGAARHDAAAGRK